MFQDDDLIQEFVVESSSHLAEIKGLLLQLEAAGFLGLTVVSALAPSLEKVLNMIRNRLVFGLIVLCCRTEMAEAQEGSVLRESSVDAMWGHRSPSYMILPRPATHSNKGQLHAYVTPTNALASKPVSPYAYGWFGTKPSPHWHRQFGSQDAYTQWTLR